MFINIFHDNLKGNDDRSSPSIPVLLVLIYLSPHLLILYPWRRDEGKSIHVGYLIKFIRKICVVQTHKLFIFNRVLF